MSKKFSYFILGVAVTALFVFTLKNCNISISNKDNKLNDSTISNAQITKENIEHEEITTDVNISTKNNLIEKNTEIKSTELNNTHLPDNIALYIDSGYPTSFGKWINPNNSFIFHEFKTDTGNNDISRQGLYCIETKQYVLLSIKFNDIANWVIYCYDNGSLSEFAKGAEHMAYGENGAVYLEDCVSKWEEAVISLGLIPIDTRIDESTEISQEKAFELIGYTPE